MAQNPYQSIAQGEPGRIGWRIDYFEEVESTQDIARKLAASGISQGAVVIAERQNAGRGRMGRSWHSPSGLNLYTTIILRPSMALAEVPRLSLVAGVAAAEALETVAPGKVGLKWPNDLWLGRKKTGGIIAEAVTDSRQKLSCVLLGIGINLNLDAAGLPTELRERATSVRIATGRSCDRIAFGAALFSALDTRYMEVQARGFQAIRPRWERYSALKGTRVAILDGGRRESGVVKGIDDDGALLLETSAGLKLIVAGEVTVEGAYD